MIRRALAVVATAIAVTACSTQSRVDPDAQVSIGGRVVAPDGSPLRDRPVQLGSDISDAELGLALATIGVSCVAGACTGERFDTSTDGEGRFAFDLRGRDTRSRFGEAVPQLVSAAAAPGPGQVSGAAVAARFRVQTAQVMLPTLHLVDPDVRAEAGRTVAVRWAPAAPGPYDVTFEDGTGAPVWELVTGETSVTVDARILEDTAGRTVVGGSSEDRVEGSAVDVRWRAPGVGYAGVGAAPPSRGQPCRFVAASGAATTEEPCDLTDGDLTHTAAIPQVCDASGGACQPAVAVEIPLASPAPADLVVVRGCPTSCAVALDVPVGAAAGDAVVAFARRPVSAVRVAIGDGRGLREISVWGDVPTPPRAAPIDELRDRFAGGDAGDQDDAIPAGTAAVATALVALGAAAALRFRRRAATP